MEMPKDGTFRTSSFSNIDPVPFRVSVARTNWDEIFTAVFKEDWLPLWEKYRRKTKNRSA